jgi:hypothetical protein
MVSSAILIHPHPQPLSLHSVPSHYAIGEADRLKHHDVTTYRTPLQMALTIELPRWGSLNIHHITKQPLNC